MEKERDSQKEAEGKKKCESACKMRKQTFSFLSHGMPLCRENNLISDSEMRSSVLNWFQLHMTHKDNVGK